MMTDAETTKDNNASDIDQMLTEAVAHHQAGELDAAEQCYRAILQFEPAHPKANHNLGVLNVQMKQPADALPYLVAALDADPAHGQYWLSYIDALYQADQVETARQVLALAREQGLQGDEVDALALRMQATAQVSGQAKTEDIRSAPESPLDSIGEPYSKGQNPGREEIDKLVALFSAGSYEVAAVQAKALTTRFPEHEFGWKALGAVLKQMGRSREALAPMQRAAVLSPNDDEAQYNLGVTLHELKRLDEAEASYRRALKIKPDYADAHSNLGILLQEMKRLDEAEASYRHSLQIMPNNAAVLSNLGAVLHALGRLEEAEVCYRRALQINPDNAGSFNNLGNTLLEMGNLDEAEASYRRAVQIEPDYADAHYNLGNILKYLFRQSEAEASYRTALRIKPDNASVHCNLGVLLHNMGRIDDAESCYRRALEIAPDYAEAYKHLGAALANQGRVIDAKACYLKAGRLGFNGARVLEALMIPAIMGTRQEVIDSRAEYERNLEKLIADKVTLDDPAKEIGEANFYLAYHAMNDRDLQIKLAKFYEQACPSLLYSAPHCHKPRSGNLKQIRIGVFSRFLSSHSVSLCFSKIIEIMSVKERFEVSLLSHYPIDEKTYARFSGKRVRLPNDQARAREMIAELELDVLIYLDIGMEPLGYFLAFSRLARVQCVMAGHPVTTGIGNMDYFLSAELWESADADGHYSEKLIRLPSPPIYFERPVLPAVLKTRQELGLPDTRQLYMCPMKLQKIHPDFDAAMTRILELDGNGVVVLFEDDIWPFWKKALWKRLEKSVPQTLRERIIFLPWMKNSVDFLSAVAIADVLLDPFHFGIGSTAATSSVTGTPLVTKAGEFMRGRIGAGYCRMLGVDECITENTESYARKAVEIANDRSVREKIKTKILQNNSVLYGNQQPIEDIVNFIDSLADGWRSA